MNTSRSFAKISDTLKQIADNTASCNDADEVLRYYKDRFESFERTGEAEWAIDALTIIALFPEAVDQDFSLPNPSEAIIDEVSAAAAKEVIQPSQALSDTYDRLIQLESAPEALQRQFYTKLGAYASELTLSHPFLSAYTLFQEEQHGNDFSTAISVLQKRLQQSEE